MMTMMRGPSFNHSTNFSSFFRRTIKEPVYAREADISPTTYTKESLTNQKLEKFSG